ncbi:MAG: hypothetical protein RLZZ25_115, partial [Gemmatimonadota bacterium]
MPAPLLRRCLAGALCLAPALLPAQARPLTRWESQARDLLKELVEINTTLTTGNSVTAA